MPLKKFFAFLREPPVWFLLLLYPVTAGLIVATAYLSTSGWEEEFFAALIYTVTALLLSYAIYTIVKWVSKAKHAAKEKLRRNKYTKPFAENYSLRTLFFSALTALINFAYVIVNGVTAIYHSSTWYYVLMSYYFALMVIRLLVILLSGKAFKKYGKGSSGFLRARMNIYLFSGAALIVLEGTLSGIIAFMISNPQVTETGLVLAISNAAYTFYKVTLAIVNKVKSGRSHEPIAQSLRNLNLTDALVSLFSLNITLSAAAGELMPVEFNATLGFAVCAYTLFSGIYMIIDGIKRKKRLRNALRENAAEGAAERI